MHIHVEGWNCFLFCMCLVCVLLLPSCSHCCLNQSHFKHIMGRKACCIAVHASLQSVKGLGMSRVACKHSL